MISLRMTVIWEQLSRRFPAGVLIAAALACGIGPGSLARAADTSFSGGAFTKLTALESDLKRGTSKKMDVRRALGTPKGSGQAIFPVVHLQREVWYYEDIEFNMNEAKSDDKGVLHVPVRFQMLQVYFDGDVFDGYMWVANTQAPPPK
jgi:hypothetical protein